MSAAGAGGGGSGKRSSRLPQDKFSVAMDSLHVTAVPKSLPCRTAERNQLISFLTSNIKAGEFCSAVRPQPACWLSVRDGECMRVFMHEEWWYLRGTEDGVC